MPRIPLLLTILYLGLVQFFFGIGPAQIILSLFILIGTLAHPKSRRFILDIFPFAIFGMLYDLLRAVPKSWAGPIHVIWPYELEKMLFGFFHDGIKITPNEFFMTHTHPLLDVLTALTYSLHMLIPIGFFVWAWIQERPVAREFAQVFLVMNLFAFLTYLAFPVAPPWYVEQYGLTVGDWSIPGSAAGLIRFDRLIGIPYFQDIYAKSAWVYGAVPSMHAGFPVLMILYAHKIFSKGVLPFYLFMGLIWFAAIYLGHHYVIDLLAGGMYALASWFLMRRIFRVSK